MRIIGIDPEPSSEDRAYAAALLDGEGCISLYNHHGFCVDVRITNTTLPVLQWMRDTFGGVTKLNRTEGQYGNRKACWYWKISTEGARRFLSLVRPWLKIKHPQADLILNLKFYPRGGNKNPAYRPSLEDRVARDHAIASLRELKRRGVI